MNERDIFIAARHITSSADRGRYLAEACGADGELRRRVEELLQAQDDAGSFLQSPAAAPYSPTVSESPLTESPGTVIGPYKLLEQIGEGGFGVVFMAEQTHPVKRKVALKVIKPGMDTRQVIARFEAERQALALMEHPNIAKVLDAGATETGRPFFVMELVRGIPMTNYCDEHQLPPRERLALFLDVCHAVQHAHQKGIIHRDIKPTNVLVTQHDDKPMVKVIDFGVAKATSGQLTDKTLFTGFAQMIGTPLYMSPEQAALSGIDVDTRSDIYSLGVLLYELLTGTTPFDKSRLQGAAFDEIRRIIREEEPDKPSTRLSSLADTLPSVSAVRRMEPAKLARLMRGDLDWIVMKALEKDRGRRYETANGFAQDVQRYLVDEAVQACPPSVAYRFRKFARRNKRMLVTATLLGAMLLVLAGSFGWMARSSATQRFRNAEAVAALLDQCQDALRADRSDRAAIALEAAERRASDGGADDLAGRLARCRADLRLLRELDAIDTFRWTWTQDGSPDPAVIAARWRPALDAYGVTPDVDPPTDAAKRVNESLIRDRLLTALDLWLALAEPSAWVRAVLQTADPDPYRDAVRDALAGRDDPGLSTLAGRPETLAQPPRFAAVLGLGQLREMVTPERQRAVLESALRSRPGDLALLVEMGNSYQAEGKLEISDNSREETRERLRWYQAAVAAHPENVAARINLGAVLQVLGDLDGAIACCEEALRLDPTFALAHCNLGNVLVRKGQLDASIAAHRKSLDLDPNFGPAHYQLVYALMKKGDSDGAQAALNAAIRRDPKDPEPHYHLGLALDERGDWDGAIEAYRKAIEVDRRHVEAHNNLGAILCDEKRDYDGAIVAFKEAIRLDPTEALHRRNMGYALANRGKLDEAIAAFEEAIRLDPKHAPAHNGLGEVLREKGNTDGAIMAYRYAILADPNYAAPHRLLGAILYGVKRDYDGAIAAYQKAIEVDRRHVEAHLGLGVILCDVKRDYDGAIIAFKEAIRLDPKDPAAHYNLGNALQYLGKLDDAIAAYQEAIRLDPEYADAHYNLGAVLKAKGDASGAAASVREVIRIDPSDADAHNQLARVLATGPARVRDGKLAVEHATRACELTGWKNPNFIDTLAAAHAEAGDFDRAVEFQMKALSFPDFQQADGEGGRERLDLYERKMPYRDPALTPMED